MCAICALVGTGIQGITLKCQAPRKSNTVSRFLITLTLAVASAVLLALVAPAGIASPAGSFAGLLDDAGGADLQR